MTISIVVAISENRAIGARGNLLWRLPADMKRFREITSGHHVLMGRKTYESIPERYRPLPHRVNLVVTKQREYKAPGCVVVASVEEGIAHARATGETELMIIGGAEIYRQCLPMAQKIYLTTVHHRFDDADAFFPPLGDEWKKVSAQAFAPDEQHRYAYTFSEWVKKNSASDVVSA
ncbi:MAG: dihydrofolate reductase [Chitinophagales bacterium]|nr:dihydrofolate reductase [Chitinophagales bacterium]MDW8419920.1 dihydrofolate reductase [Chitinophagales bacterium]